jgi:hypothetical protein
MTCAQTYQTHNDALALVVVSCTRNAALRTSRPAKIAFIAVRRPADPRVSLQLTLARTPTSGKAPYFARTSLPRSP